MGPTTYEIAAAMVNYTVELGCVKAFTRTEALAKAWQMFPDAFDIEVFA